MPRAEIASKQAIFTLSQLHAELAGKFAENRNAGVKIKTAMMQVEAVLQMLQPSFDVRSISAKRRNKSNPWFKRGTLFRSAVDVLRRAAAPMTAPGDCRSADSRQGPSGRAQAGHRPTGSYSCRATEAQRSSGHWRRRTSAMAAERVHQLKRPYFVSFRTRSISYSASFIAAARLIGVTPDLCLPSPSLTSHRQPPPSVN
jgi:hypothetical protein